MFCRKCGIPVPDGTDICGPCQEVLQESLAANAGPSSVAEAIPGAVPTSEAAPFTEEMYSFPTENVSQLPQSGSEQVEYSGFQVVEPVKRRKSWKKTAIIISSGVLVLLLVALLLFWLLVLRSPQYELLRAGEKTVEELNEIFEGNENLLQIYACGADLLESREYSLVADIRESVSFNDEEPQESNMGLAVNYSGLQKQLNLVFDTDMGDVNAQILNLYLDQEQLLLDGAMFGKTTWSVPMARFGEVFRDSKLSKDVTSAENREFLNQLRIDLFADATFLSYLEKLGGPEELLKSFEIQKTESTIPETSNLKVYELRCDYETYAELNRGYLEFQLAAVLGQEALAALPEELREELGLEEQPKEDAADYIVRFGINADGYLSAVQLFEDGEEEESLIIVLNGTSNIWNDIVIHYDGEKERFSLAKEAGGFRLDRVRDSATGVSAQNTILTWKDAEEQMVFGESDVTVSMSLENGGIRFGYVEDMSEEFLSNSLSMVVTVEVFFRPLQEIEKPEGETEQVFDYSSEELEDAFVEGLFSYMIE